MIADWLSILSIVLNAALSGTLVVTVATLKQTVKKAKAEAELARADVERLKNDNEKSAMSTFREYIVEPLQTEIKGLRRDVKNLRKAINTANNCPHSDDCPVLDELQKQSDTDCGDFGKASSYIFSGDKQITPEDSVNP